jgi:hypothetical protein
MSSNWRCIMSLVLMVGLSLQTTTCSPLVMRDPWSLPPDAHDMDKVVNSKGVPLNVMEMTSHGYGREIRTLTLMYSDETFRFMSNADRSLTRLEYTMSMGCGSIQSPVPAWFKVKYPHLDYPNVPTAK